MRELIEQVKHDEQLEDWDKPHDPAVCLRCRMEAAWAEIEEDRRGESFERDLVS